ncbi:AlkA N-terminal domain-containing protein [Microbacteriaceae bacterium 4G12]
MSSFADPVDLVREEGPAGIAVARFGLRAHPPFDTPGLFRYFETHAVPGLESWTEQGFARAMRLPLGMATVTLAPTGEVDSPGVSVSARLSHADDLPELIRRVRRLCDLDARPDVIDDALAEDAVLAPAVRRTPGVRIPGSPDPHETLFRTVLGQQISIAAARTVQGRLAVALGDPLPEALAGDVTHVFPSAERIAERGREVLRGPARRIDSMMLAAASLASGAVRVDEAVEGPELRRSLVALPGIGPWTADYLAMRVLRDTDVLLATDLVVRQAATRLGLPTAPVQLAARGGAWSPWRSYATLHLWRTITDPPPDYAEAS